LANIALNAQANFVLRRAGVSGLIPEYSQVGRVRN
jgi:hypothetical protein